MTKCLLFILALLCVAWEAPAQQLGEKDPKPLSAGEQRARFKVPPGFEVQLVADESHIQKPININFDTAGRLWVTGSTLYPWPAATDASGNPIPNFEKAYDELASAFGAKGKAPAFSKEGKDSVRVLSDFDAQGRATRVRVFADRLNIPTGIQPLSRSREARGDTIVVYSIPNIWRMTDTDGDGVADQREILYGPFGFLDTHGGASSFNYWIDGWIYGTHGFRNHSEVKDRAGHVTVFDSGNTYRFRPDGTRIEYWAHGQTNPFGLTFDSSGNLYSADCHSKPVYLLLRGGYYEGIGKQHDGLGFAPAMTNDDHGSSGICGIAYYEAPQFPAEYQGDLFVGNCVTGRINRDKLEWHGSTPKAIRQPDFLTCDDPWFRPVDVKLGPDGALYIADFYNYIIGHYEVPLTDPRRDNSRGRIWRVVWKGDKESPVTRPITNLTESDTNALIEKTRDPNLVVRTHTTHELVARAAKEVPLAQGAGTANRLWVLARLGVLNEPILEKAAALDEATFLAIMAARDDASTDSLLSHLHSSRAAVQKSAAEALTPREGTIARAWSEFIAQHPSESGLVLMLRGLEPTLYDKGDLELVYARKIAIREILQSPEGYAWAAKMMKIEFFPQLLAEISIAVPTPQAAEFLLNYLLSRDPLAAEPVAAAVRHVALYLPGARLNRLHDLIALFKDAPTVITLPVADHLSRAIRQRGIEFPAEVVHWSEQIIIAALQSSDERTLKQAIDAAREMTSEKKYAPIASIVQDGKRSGPVRTAALDALANSNSMTRAVAAALNDPSSMTLRKRAAELIGQSNAKEARDALLHALPTAPWELATTIAAGLVKTDEGCEQLLATLESGKASPALLRNKAVAAPLEKRAATLRARAANLTSDLPPEDARLDQLIAQRVNEFRAAAPDPTHGAVVFQQQCFVCHRVKGQGGNIGPNLDGVGVRGLHRLLEDILDPNRNVDPAFRQTVIETNDGRMIAGVNVRAEGELVLLNDAEGKEQSVVRKQIKSQTASRLSLMPPTFEQTLSGKDLNDVVAYLLAQTNAVAK